MMNTSTDFFARDQFKGLLAAIDANSSDDSMSRLVSPRQWETIADFLQLFTLASGQELIRQGGTDRSLYFVEEGNLTVHYEDANGRIRLAVLGPGAALWWAQPHHVLRLHGAAVPAVRVHGPRRLQALAQGRQARLTGTRAQSRARQRHSPG